MIGKDEIIRMVKAEKEKTGRDYDVYFDWLEKYTSLVQAHTQEQCAKVCDDYPKRDPAEDGNGYWAAEECAAAIRAMK